MTDNIRALLRRAIDTYGSDRQKWKAMEELGELITAIARQEDCPEAVAPEYGRHIDNMAEEIADVRIMLDQICMIFDIESRAVQWRWHKLARLKERLDQRERLSLQAQPEGQDAGETRGCAERNDAGRKERLDQRERLSLQAQPEGQDAGETRGCAERNDAGRKERLDRRERLSPQAQPEGQDAGETRGCAERNDAGRKERLDRRERLSPQAQEADDHD